MMVRSSCAIGLLLGQSEADMTGGASANALDLGECKAVMIGYLSCIKKSKGMNDEECRNLAKSYLSCRMDR
jgi:hypothetical protein